MNRIEAEDYIYQSYLRASKHQNYEDKDAQKRDPSITRTFIQSLCNTPCVVVTGSKGKGSVANMIANIMQTQKTTGLMTSPHLVDFCERFKVNGQDMAEEDFIKMVETVKPTFDEIDRNLPDERCISPMGIQAAIALLYFAGKRTAFNVFECGKGAKYDDVNNIPHDYAVINSIFLEHTRELGGSLESIAVDKSHVILPGMETVYVAEQQPQVMSIINERARQCQVRVKVYGKDFKCDNVNYSPQGMTFDVFVGETCYPHITIPLMGMHQAKNCALALALCQEVLGALSLDDIRFNLLHLRWPGRMEVLSSAPFVLLDACINRESCPHVRQVLQQLKIHRYSLVIGIPDDKDFSGVAEAMHMEAQRIVLTKSQNPHYVFTPHQISVLAEKGISSTFANSIQEALQLVLPIGDPVVILGTTSVVSEVYQYFLIHFSSPSYPCRGSDN